MAARYLAIDLGKGADIRAVQVSATTTGRDIELKFDTATTGINRTQLMIAIKTIHDSLVAKPWPLPAS